MKKIFFFTLLLLAVGSTHAQVESNFITEVIIKRDASGKTYENKFVKSVITTSEVKVTIMNDAIYEYKVKEINRVQDSNGEYIPAFVAENGGKQYTIFLYKNDGLIVVGPNKHKTIYKQND